MANKKGSRQLTWTDRISIEALKKGNCRLTARTPQHDIQRSKAGDIYGAQFRPYDRGTL